MTNYIDALFLLQFLVFFGLIGLKLINIFREATIYKMDIFIMTWIGLVFSYGIGLICTIINYETLSTGILFNFESVFFLFAIVLFMAELFLYIKKDTIPAANARKELTRGE